MVTALANRVLVIDDDFEGRDQLMDELRDFDIEPLTVDGPYGQDIERMLGDIGRLQPSFVICDHKLQSAGLASFHGSEVVRRLLADHMPAMLLTMYQSTERLDLRAARSYLPVVMARDEFQIERIEDYLQTCVSEINDEPVETRRPHRVIIRVDEVPEDEFSPRIDAVIPSWSPDRAVAIPRSSIDRGIVGRIRAGTYLLGEVNIGAKTEDDLYFRNIEEIVPPPDEAIA